jgi:hypothetical protein
VSVPFWFLFSQVPPKDIAGNVSGFALGALIVPFDDGVCLPFSTILKVW